MAEMHHLKAHRRRAKGIVLALVAILPAGCGSVYHTSMNEYLLPAQEVFEERLEAAVEAQSKALDDLFALQSTLGALRNEAGPASESLQREARLRVELLELAAWNVRRTLLSVSDAAEPAVGALVEQVPADAASLSERMMAWRDSSRVVADELDRVVAAARARLEAASDSSASGETGAILERAAEAIWKSMTAKRLLLDELDSLPSESTPPWMRMRAGEP